MNEQTSTSRARILHSGTLAFLMEALLLTTKENLSDCCLQNMNYLFPLCIQSDACGWLLFQTTLTVHRSLLLRQTTPERHKFMLLSRKVGVTIKASRSTEINVNVRRRVGGREAHRKLWAREKVKPRMQKCSDICTHDIAMTGNNSSAILHNLHSS